MMEAGTGQTADHSVLVTLDPQPSVQNEDTPYGEIPEATRPESEEATRPESERHARAPRTLAHTKGKGHAAQTKRKLTSFDPRRFRTPRVKDNALVASHAPSGWLVDRAAGLRARTLSLDAASSASPLGSVYNGGVSESICEQHRFPIRVLGSDPTFWGLYARPDVGRAENQLSFPNVFCLDTSGRPKTPAPGRAKGMRVGKPNL